MAVYVGSVLAGRYEVVAPIASGGMGEVWQARDRTLGRIIAAKVLRSEYTSDPSFLIRFRNEARLTAALSHPNIASVYDYGESTQDGQRVAYLVMEYVEGTPLVTVLADEGRLSPQRTLDVVGQAAEGLSAAHAVGMVHRDIKPGNLIVRPDGVVKLTDFGIARARDAVPLTRTGMVVGTAQYLSPEQAQGFPVTPASDVYSLGVLAYECLAGVRPFDGESQVAIALAQINRPPPPLPSDVPAPVRALVERALAKDPADRFPDGAAVAAAVRAVAHGAALPPHTAATGLMAGMGDHTEMLPSPGLAGGGPRIGPQTAPRTMPPLHGPPVGGGDDVYDDLDLDEDERDPGKRRRLLWAIAGLVLVLLVGGGVALALSGGNDPGSGTAGPSTSPAVTSTAAGTSAAGGFFVDANAYIGEDADRVQTTLEAQGLQVRQRAANSDQIAQSGRHLAAGTVAAVDPADATVPAGDLVTLYVAENGSPADDSTATPTQTAGGPGGSAPTTHAPAPTTKRSSAPATVEPTPPTQTSDAGSGPTTRSRTRGNDNNNDNNSAAPSTTQSSPAVNP